MNDDFKLITKNKIWVEGLEIDINICTKGRGVLQKKI